MENLVNFYKNKRILVTGHTGFKGSWLCEWLIAIGAEVYGLALPPPTVPSLFEQLKLSKRIKKDIRGDIRDINIVRNAVREVKPDVIFHLAAQPLVRLSYKIPAETFETNVMGTVNILEALRLESNGQSNNHSCHVVCITTDKVYENDNSGKPFVEDDPKGGSDPYSASKGACEIAIQSYQCSFFYDPNSMIWVSSARAGNVIGGGDWALDRILPDAMRAFLKGDLLTVRNVKSTRPWQHVLEPLYGYLLLGAQTEFAKFSTAYNFGPSVTTVKTVGELVNEIMLYFPNAKFRTNANTNDFAEAKLLTLCSDKAFRMLGWKPHWGFKDTIRNVVEWYQAVEAGCDAIAITDNQIEEFMK